MPTKLGPKSVKFGQPWSEIGYIHQTWPEFGQIRVSREGGTTMILEASVIECPGQANLALQPEFTLPLVLFRRPKDIGEDHQL